MPTYHRLRVPGGTYFFTVALADRRSDLLIREISALRTAVARTIQLHPFTIEPRVVLPDHIHAVWTLPAQDTNFSLRWTLIRRSFSVMIPLIEPRSRSRIAKGERGLWQRRFWEHAIRDDTDLAHHIDDIHFNPVKHNLAPTPSAWPYSSFHRAVATIQKPGTVPRTTQAILENNADLTAAAGP